MGRTKSSGKKKDVSSPIASMSKGFPRSSLHSSGETPFLAPSSSSIPFQVESGQAPREKEYRNLDLLKALADKMGADRKEKVERTAAALRSAVCTTDLVSTDRVAEDKGKSVLLVSNSSTSSSSSSRGDWSLLDKVAVAAKFHHAKAKVAKHQEALKLLEAKLNEEQLDSGCSSKAKLGSGPVPSSVENLQKTTFIASDHEKGVSVSDLGATPSSSVATPVLQSDFIAEDSGSSLDIRVEPSADVASIKTPVPENVAGSPSSTVQEVGISVPMVPSPPTITPSVPTSSPPKRKKVLASKRVGQPRAAKKPALGPSFFSVRFISKAAADKEKSFGQRAFLS